MSKAVYSNGCPKKIMIGHRDYKVLLRTPAEDAQLGGAFGYHMTNEDNIVLDKTVTAPRMRAVLLHELFHCLTQQYGNAYTNDVTRPKKELNVEEFEHFYIDLWENPLLEVMRANPLLMEFWLAPNPER